MNAQQARRLATGTVTTEQETSARAVAAQIEQAARRGSRSTYISPVRPQWLTGYLRDQGFEVIDLSNQKDGPTLEVRW